MLLLRKVGDFVVVVFLSILVHFNLGISPQDSWFPGLNAPVFSINMTESMSWGGRVQRRNASRHVAQTLRLVSYRGLISI